MSPRLLLKTGAHLRGRWLFAALLIALLSVRTATTPAVELKCAGSTTVAGFKLVVESPQGGDAIPVRDVNQILPGYKIDYQPGPSQATDRAKTKAQVVLIVAQSGASGARDIKVLKAEPAFQPAQWKIPIRATLVGLVYGPDGLSVKHVTSLVEKNPDMLPQLAAYAQQSTQVEALVQTLTTFEQAPAGSDLNSALQGFSTRFSVPVPKLDTSAPSNQQAQALLQGILPSLSTYDPLNPSRSALVQQSVGLASAVAGLFLGTPVGLAAGGVSLFENMRTLAFPGTDFRAAFAQDSNGAGVQLCAKPQPQKSRMRPAYLWMLGVPDAAAPAFSLSAGQRLGIGPRITVKVSSPHASDLRLASRARNWRLEGEHGSPMPVQVLADPDSVSFEVDLGQTHLAPGRYRLAADWDWSPMPVAGSLDMRNYGTFSAVRPSSETADKLIAGTGKMEASFSGADFEFVRKVALVDADGKSDDLSFTVPRPAGDGPWDTLRAKMDMAKLTPGPYSLELMQGNGESQRVPVDVHAPNPDISSLPLKANLGEPSQSFELSGTGLERIQKIESPGAIFELASAPAGATNLRTRAATVRLNPGAQVGQHFAAKMTISGIQQPIGLADAVAVAGPRPKITSAQTFVPQSTENALRAGELPAQLAVSFTIRTENADAAPSLTLSCANSADTIAELTVRPASADPKVRLDIAGDNSLFLSLDPGTVGRSGCLLSAVLETPAGVSSPYSLGRVMRLPHIEKFTLLDKHTEGRLYEGTLIGQDLQLIEKTGWTPRAGYAVIGVPTPVSDDPANQTLEIALPWPPPSPQAPLYIWLRGETEARATDARY